jgi:hypothetical protein
MARNSPENTMRFEFQINLKPVQQIVKKIDVKKESPLRQSLVLAYQIEDLFDKGRVKSLSEVSVWLNMCNARISQIMNLLCLAPEIQNQILLQQDKEIKNITEYHIRFIAMEGDWVEQRKMWKGIELQAIY